MLDILGMPVKDLIAKHGKPSRIEGSEYGFLWNIYSKDYSKYLMAGVAGSTVAAAYSNSKLLTFRKIRPGDTRDAVRSILGKPMGFVRRGSTVRILNDTGKKDHFDLGGTMAVVFYDALGKGGVSAVLAVPVGTETDALIDRPALSDDLTAAYGRISADLVNAARARMGIKLLAQDPRIAKMAFARSADMRDKNYFSHIAPDGTRPETLAEKLGIRYRRLGENIAYGNHNAILAHESFLASPDHAGILLNPAYTRIGTGAAYGGTRYVILTQVLTG